MAKKHSVEKIGGTSMAKTDAIMDNIFTGNRKQSDIYNRIFVVSAYAGITNKLLEDKKTAEPGVYDLFSGADSQWAWGDTLTEVCEEMCRINADIFKDPRDLQNADHFVKERIEGARSCLIDLHRLCSFGHFKLEEHLMTVREMLSAIGEAHSAYNTAMLLQAKGVNARFVDLTGWRDERNMALDARINEALKGLDLKTELPIVTGYAQCEEGLMSTFDRGYTEMTFSRVAVLTKAREAIIHKEYHLSSADPLIVGKDKVRPIGDTNYDVADQLSLLGMEAVHPRAAKGLRQARIPLRVRNTFQPDHLGTLIQGDYVSAKPSVEIIAGRRNVYAIEFFEQDIVGVHGYDEKILTQLARFKTKIVSKDLNANTITHYVGAPLKTVKRVTSAIEQLCPNAQVQVRKVSIVSAIGSDINIPGVLARAVNALGDADIEILATHQPMRRVDMQFVIDDAQYETAVKALHAALIETETRTQGKRAA